MYWKPENMPSFIDKKVELIDNQLYFAVIKDNVKKMRSTLDTFYFSVDDEYHYQNYYCDFGPFNISCLFKYCFKLNRYLEYAKGLKRVVHCTCSNSEKKVNSAFLIGCFCVIYLNMHPDYVYKLIYNAGPFQSFVDASQCPNQYNIKLIDCYNAVAKALTFNFFDLNDFDSSEYDTYDKLQFGDMNWLVPRKFLAFIGPTDKEYITSHTPKFYLKYFLQNDIKTVIRLNNPVYDSTLFTNAGIEHIDLFFPDGTTPPKDILLKFLAITESASGAIAVHCKAGLGRTGSLIGAYIIKHYHLTAREAIAWMRICRPGSVIGQQQGWLEKIEPWLWKSGSQYRIKLYGEGDKIPRHKYGIYSKKWPLDREKLLNRARKSIQNTFTQHQVNTIKRKQSLSVDEISLKAGKHIRQALANDKAVQEEPSADCHAHARTQTIDVQKTDSDVSSAEVHIIVPNQPIYANPFNPQIERKIRAYPNFAGGTSSFEKKLKTQGDKLLEIKARYNSLDYRKKPQKGCP